MTPPDNSEFRSSEYRTDPITGAKVIIAPARALRPDEFRAAADESRSHSHSSHEPSAAPCPFCAGSEDQTPHSLLEYRAEHSPSTEWQVRVIPNKFPAVTVEAQSETPASDSFSPDLDSINIGRRCLPVPHAAAASISSSISPGFGSHEVIIESPRHVISLSQLTDEEILFTWRAYVDRMLALKKDGRFQYAQIFKNSGEAAGASLEHAHSQLVALPFVPATIEQELSGAKSYWQQHGQCPWCAMVTRELAGGARLVAETPHFVVLCPWASRFTLETWIIPKNHSPRLEEMPAEALAELPKLLRHVVLGWESWRPLVAYNYLIHTAPLAGSDSSREYEHYHWHLELFPRETKIAGFEWGTGCFINAISPEKAAEMLRKLG